MRPTLLVSAFMLALLAVAARGDVKVPATGAPAETANALRGRWQLTHAKTVRNGCGVVVLAAQHVDVGADSLRADVVDRVYRHRGPSERGEEQFEGEFSERDQCAGINLHETWRLDFAHQHGSLSSTWRLPPACERPCTTEFAFDLQKVPAPRHE